MPKAMDPKPQMTKADLEERTETSIQVAKKKLEDLKNPLKHRLLATTDLSKADSFIARHARDISHEIHAHNGAEFLFNLKPDELTILRQATLRAHRKANGMKSIAPTIEELDVMIMAVGPFACENMLRKAVDEKRGEQKGALGMVHNDWDFIRKAKKI